MYLFSVLDISSLPCLSTTTSSFYYSFSTNSHIIGMYYKSNVDKLCRIYWEY